MGKKVDTRDFVTEAFDYLTTLEEVSINRSANRYLLEWIANGFATYGCTVEDFEEHVDDWIRKLVLIYPELGYDHKNHQIKAVIDLVDQLIVIDDDLIDRLRYVIGIQKKYGIFIKYKDKKGNKNQTTIAEFFEYITRMYPVIKARYKGLGSSAASVSREVIMDPKTRRLVRITMNDVHTMMTMSKLVGDSKEDRIARKEMLMNFRFTKADIDN